MFRQQPFECMGGEEEAPGRPYGTSSVRKWHPKEKLDVSVDAAGVQDLDDDFLAARSGGELEHARAHYPDAHRHLAFFEDGLTPFEFYGLDERGQSREVFLGQRGGLGVSDAAGDPRRFS